MTAAPSQSLATHKRYIPGFHYVTGGLIVANLAWALARLILAPSGTTASSILTAIVLAQLFWYTRQFPLRVQDRVICLEEHLRLAQLLPADLRSRVSEFTPDQLIALRFASDAEVPVLARRVLVEHLVDRDTIKALIASWRPDMARA